jgi:Fe-S cluster assembly iron-binding protein IscA
MPLQLKIDHALEPRFYHHNRYEALKMSSSNQPPKGDTLMPLKVTDQAAAALQQLLEDQDPKPAQVLRLVSNTEGNFLLALDTKKDGDQVVRHKGRMVMVIGPSVSESLSGHILDWKQTRSGRSFTFGKGNN